MKKSTLLLGIVVALVAAYSLTSCQSTAYCPTYSHIKSSVGYNPVKPN